MQPIEPTPHQPFDQPVQGEALHRRAAGTLWTLGVIELLLAGCCLTGAASLIITPSEQLERMMAEQNVPPELLVQLQQMAVPIIVVIGLLGLLPAVGYLILGFSVRQGKKPAATFAMLIAMTQAIVIGVVLLLNLFEAARGGSPANITFNLLTFGTLLVLLIYTIRLLLAVRAGPVDDLSTDPWDQPYRD